jgi:hypothetical protein
MDSEIATMVSAQAQKAHGAFFSLFRTEKMSRPDWAEDA